MTRITSVAISTAFSRLGAITPSASGTRAIAQIAKEDAEGALAIQKRDTTLAAMQRGEGTLVRTPIRAVIKYTGPHISSTAHKSYDEMTKPHQIADVHNSSALNVDYVVRNAARLDFTLDNYADSLRSEIANAPKDTVFTGAWGKDRITHSVEEYAGWLKQAAAAYAKTASLSD